MKKASSKGLLSTTAGFTGGAGGGGGSGGVGGGGSPALALIAAEEQLPTEEDVQKMHENRLQVPSVRPFVLTVLIFRTELVLIVLIFRNCFLLH